jgi:hypothetical protein
MSTVGTANKYSSTGAVLTTLYFLHNLQKAGVFVNGEPFQFIEM